MKKSWTAHVLQLGATGGEEGSKLTRRAAVEEPRVLEGVQDPQGQSVEEAEAGARGGRGAQGG